MNQQVNQTSLITLREFKVLSLSILLAICGSLGTDIHLASLPHIMAYMHTNQQHMQQSVTTFILGVGVSVLVYGPLSDKFGRKPIVLFGLTLACLASYAAAFVQDITTFLILRTLQGMGSGVCWGLGRIIAADVMQGERLAAIGSYFTLFLSLSPLLAPVIGGYMQHWFGWQSNFILLGSIILVVIIVYAFLFEETNEHKRAGAFHPVTLVKTYLSFFYHRIFVGCIILTGISMSANIVYVTISSFIFQKQFHTSAIVYGWLTATVGIAGVVGKLISPFFILRFKNQKALLIGIALLVLSGIFLTVFALANAVSITIVLIGVSLAILALVFVGSTTMAMALSPFHDKRGSAGALFSSFQLLISFVVSAYVASLPHLGTSLLAGTYLVLGILSVLCYLFLLRR